MCLNGRIKSRLHGDRGVDIKTVKFGQVVLVDPGQTLSHVHIAVEINVAVGRVIIAAVKIQIILIGEIRNIDRIAAGLMLIRRVGIEDRVDLPPQDIIRLREGTLHLVVDNAVDRDLTVGTVRLVMPALLAENILLFINIGIKNRIQVDMHEVFKILLVAAGHRIDRLIRISHCVQESVQRTFGKLNERILDREIPGTAEHRMLNDVGDAGGILRRRTEGDIKDLVVIIFRQQRYTRTRLFVPEQPAVTARIRQELMRNDLISGKSFDRGLAVNSCFIFMGQFHIWFLSPFLGVSGGRFL